MNSVTPKPGEIHPFYQLLLLLAYAFVGLLVFSAIAVLIIVIIYGTSILSNFGLITSGDPQYNFALKIFQMASSIGIFIVPPIFLAITQKQNPSTLFGLLKPKYMPLLLVFIIMMVSMPFMEWSVTINQKMVLPEFLRGVEQWMKAKEAEAMKMTIQLLTVRNNWDFVINLTMIAVLPAIGEELFFRGGLQRIAYKTFGNPHVAIWITAIVFSAIHVQFYGFLPRMLLGAGFGYLYYYSGNLWYAILGHFINNGYAVCAALYMQMHNIPLNKADDPIGFPWYGYLISAIITIALFKIFKDTIQRERKLD
ncbi:CPBP family intramembrane metalloprotease [Pedobacter changchengzhani]|uniref:CPBP family intramembrane metalloprotease n=1 Tax=Pedobacter changchengzhani TaxID=2529274 RepID=A0A4R5MNR8_9SPHI|nr:CPBP family intramembrane glutamic endopeptidase [Pedobacter changchengzhani]TDG37414.1 CPBP family intramembrane metalloprotease [Pedobacter changchengzhani]